MCLSPRDLKIKTKTTIDKQVYYDWGETRRRFHLPHEWIIKHKQLFTGDCDIRLVSRSKFGARRKGNCYAINWFALNRLCTIMAFREVMNCRMGSKYNYSDARCLTDAIGNDINLSAFVLFVRACGGCNDINDLYNFASEFREINPNVREYTEVDYVVRHDSPAMVDKL